MKTSQRRKPQILGLTVLALLAGCASVEQAGKESPETVVGIASQNPPASALDSGTGGTVSEPAAKESTSVGAASADAPKRTALAGFTMKTLDGKPWTLADQKGKVVLLNFWATWCPPCREEMPDLVALSKKYKERGFELVGVSMDENADAVAPSFVKEHSIPFKILVPKGDESVLSYAQGGIPTSVLIDKKGGVESATTGMISGDVMSEQIESLLKEKA